jgi:hypothetical protein
MKVRVRSRFEFQIGLSNQGTTMTTDQKGALFFYIFYQNHPQAEKI